MKKLTNLLEEMVYDLRKKRNAPFMFMPQEISWKDWSVILYYEFFDTKEADMYLVTLFIQEIITQGLLIQNPVRYYAYELDSMTFHDVYLTTSDNETFCRGTSTNKSEAYAKAFGELFERTALRYNDGKLCISKSADDLQKNTIPHVLLDAFPQATELQKKTFPKSDVTNRDIFSWINVTNAKDRKEYYIPAQTVFFNNYLTYPDEKVIIESSTHGAGAGYSKQSALKSGICEIINRHYFLESWYKGESPEKIDVGSIPHTSNAYGLCRDLEKRGFTVHLLNYSSKALIPSVIAIIVRDGGWSCGGTSGTTMEAVIKRSVHEAFSSYLWYENIVIQGGCTYGSDDVNAVKSGFVDAVYGDSFSRVMLYNHAYFLENRPEIRKFLEGVVLPYTKKYDQPGDFDILGHAVSLFGDVYYYFPEKEYLKRYEYHSVKVIIPNTFFFSLSEIHSRPVRNGTYPQNIEINPFP